MAFMFKFNGIFNALNILWHTVTVCHSSSDKFLNNLYSHLHNKWILHSLFKQQFQLVCSKALWLLKILVLQGHLASRTHIVVSNSFNVFVLSYKANLVFFFQGLLSFATLLKLLGVLYFVYVFFIRTFKCQIFRCLFLTVANSFI